MKYYIVKDAEGLQSKWGIFDTQQEAEAKANGTKTVIRNGEEVTEPNYSFNAVVVASDKTPDLVQFEKVNGVWIDTERALTAQDFAAQYKPRRNRGNQIVEQVRTERLIQVASGVITIAQASAIDAETKLIQFTLKEGDILTAKVLLEQLPDSSHKTEFLALVNTAISELY